MSSEQPESEAPTDAGSPARLGMDGIAPFERRRIAFSLGLKAPVGDRDSLLALLGAYERFAEDPFLGATMLEALGMLAQRDHLARIELLRVIARLPSPEGASPDLRYLYIAAARTINRVSELSVDPYMRRILIGWASAPDPGIQAESRFRFALLEFQKAFQASTKADLIAGLASASAALARAKESEELRPDAHLLCALTQEILSVASGELDDAPVSVVRPAVLDLIRTAYLSPREVRITRRAWRIINSLRSLRTQLREKESWIRLDESVLGLAHIVEEVVAGPDDPDFAESLSKIGERVVLPRLGAELSQCINALQMKKILERLESEPVSPATLDCIRSLESVISAHSGKPGSLLEDPAFRSKLGALAESAGKEPHAFLAGLIEDLADGDPHGQVPQLLDAVVPLPWTRAASLSGDTDVDETVRHICQQVHAQVRTSSRQRWSLFVDVTCAIVEHIKHIRQTLPDFARSEPAGGMGQRASEADLQESLHRRLRDEFGNAAQFEASRLSPGRLDLALVFPECRFPIEVKHEFRDVSREHVRAAYLSQSDTYAASTDGVGYCAVLDLRDEDPSRSLYTLVEGVWIDFLPPDPQIQGASVKPVVVLLVPGNRSRPSDLTTYSQRPRSARTRRT